MHPYIWSSFIDKMTNPSFSWLRVSSMQNVTQFNLCLQLYDGDGALVNPEIKYSYFITRQNLCCVALCKCSVFSATYSVPQTVWMSMLTQVGRWEGEKPLYLGLAVSSACMNGWGYTRLLDIFQFVTALHPHRSNINECSMHIWSIACSQWMPAWICSAQLYLYLTCLRIHACI